MPDTSEKPGFLLINVVIPVHYVHRGTVPGGPYAKLNASPIGGSSYVDNNVVSGQTYFYVATSVDWNNNESAYSNQATVVSAVGCG